MHKKIAERLSYCTQIPDFKSNKNGLVIKLYHIIYKCFAKHPVYSLKVNLVFRIFKYTYLGTIFSIIYRKKNWVCITVYTYK